MTEFIWIEWNIAKVENHHLSADEVEFAWRSRKDVRDGLDPVHGPFTVSEGKCPSGRLITIVWRYNMDLDGYDKVFVITAYGP